MSKLEDWKKDKQWKGVDPSHEWTYHTVVYHHVYRNAKNNCKDRIQHRITYIVKIVN